MSETPRKRRKRPSHAKSVNVHDVAREAGVSVASVSRVVNMPDKVGAAVRARVEAAIKKLDYVPDGTARAMITRRTRIVGALIPTIAYSVYSGFIEALQARLRRDGYTLLLGLTGYERATEVAELRQMLIAGAEAIMLAGEQHDPEVYRLLEARKIPYVLNSVYHPDSAHPCVGYDNRGAARHTANHLLDLGHRHIAVITGNRAVIDRFAERVEGVRDALADRGLALPEPWVVERGVTVAKARDGFRQVMAGKERPSAIICGNDVMAFGALLEAQAMGIKVPGELSITGFDDVEWSAQLAPSLTTVHIPLDQMGARAADYLLGRLSGEPVSHATKIEVNLVLRQSTGPCQT